MERLRMRGLAALCLAAVVALSAGCAGTGAAGQAGGTEEEQVDVGYTSVPKDQYTGSATTIREDEIRSRNVTHVEELLEGRVAGVRVLRTRSGFKVQIRGVGTFVGNTDPLYVIDGIPVEPGPDGGLMGINPQDIAEITVLKDPGSLAMYGVRGRNGVIVIRTKRGP